MSMQVEIQKKLTRIQPIYQNGSTKSNIAPLLDEIYFWSSVEKFAKEKVKSGYKELVEEKLIKPDDEYRNEKGEKIILETPKLLLIYKVAEPRQSFDKDAFIERVATELKVSKLKLKEIAKQTMKSSISPLTKAVIEKS